MKNKLSDNEFFPGFLFNVTFGFILLGIMIFAIIST